MLQSYLIVKVPRPFCDVIVTRGGLGTLPQFNLQDIIGLGTPTASQVIVTVDPLDAFTNRWGGVMITGDAAKDKIALKSSLKI